MKLYTSLIFGLLIIPVIPSKKVALPLGTTKCYVDIYQQKSNTIPVIRLHGNENTCIHAYFDLPVSTPFTLYKLSQRGKRLLKFKENHKSYFFDPNRMFSKKGIVQTLKKYNTSYPGDLVEKISMFSHKILKICRFNHAGKQVIAIHNNTNGNFSVKTYRRFAKASRIFISPSEDPDDFFIVTKADDFNYFKKRKENVVLQSHDVADDGSLSVYCAAHNIRYINVEAQYGHLQKQKQMLLLCYQLLDTLKEIIKR